MNKSLIVSIMYCVIFPMISFGAVGFNDKYKNDGLTVIGMVDDEVWKQPVEHLQYTIYVEPNPLAQPEVTLSKNYSNDTYFSHLKEEKLIRVSLEFYPNGQKKDVKEVPLDNKYQAYKGFKFKISVDKKKKNFEIKVSVKKKGGEATNIKCKDNTWKCIKNLNFDRSEKIVFAFDKDEKKKIN
jgi:hypothetical protein